MKGVVARRMRGDEDSGFAGTQISIWNMNRPRIVP